MYEEGGFQHIAKQESALITHHWYGIFKGSFFPQGEYCIEFLNPFYCNSDDCFTLNLTVDLLDI